MSSTYQLFERAEKVEAVAARIYAGLAKAFRGTPEVKAVFVRLQAEEEQHAARIRLLAAHYRHDPKLPVEADGAELDACLEEATRALAELEAGRWGQDLAGAKARVAALEERLAAAHAQVIARSTRVAVRTFFEALAEQDDAHARLLAELGPP